MTNKNIFLTKIVSTDNWIFFIGFFSVLPFLLISLYVNPSADDIIFHNISNEYGFANAQLYWFQNWTGRYFSTAILSIQALVASPYYLYKFLPVLFIVSLFFSIYCIIFLLFNNFKKKECLLLTIVVMVIYLIEMPTVSEGFYWLAGSVTYQLSNIIFIWLTYFMIKFLETNKNKYFLVVLLLSIIAIGTNETTMLFVDLFLLVICVFDYYKYRRVNFFLLSILLVAIISSAVVYLSPGNVIRAATYPSKQKIGYALMKTVAGIFTYCIKWFPFMVISIFIYVDYLNKKEIHVTSSLFKIKPVFVAFFLCGILFIGFFTSYWSIGEGPQLRTLNTVYFFFLLTFMYFIFVLQIRFKAVNKVLFSFSKEIKWFLILLVFLSIGKKNNIKLAYKDLLSGDAAIYNLELENRYQLIKNSNDKNCIVPKLKSKPVTIFGHDITKDPKEWKNVGYSIYFGKETIVTY